MDKVYESPINGFMQWKNEEAETPSVIPITSISVIVKSTANNGNPFGSSYCTDEFVPSMLAVKNYVDNNVVNYLGSIGDEEDMLDLPGANTGDFCYRRDTQSYWELGRNPSTDVNQWHNLTPTATVNKRGLVRPGVGLNIASNGTISVALPSVLNTAGVITLSQMNGNLYKASISSVTNFTLSGSVTSDVWFKFYLEIENTSASSAAVTFAFCSGWYGESVSTVAAGKVTRIEFETSDGGTNWYGRLIGIR